MERMVLEFSCWGGGGGGEGEGGEVTSVVHASKIVVYL